MVKKIIDVSELPFEGYLKFQANIMLLYGPETNPGGIGCKKIDKIKNIQPNINKIFNNIKKQKEVETAIISSCKMIRQFKDAKIKCGKMITKYDDNIITVYIPIKITDIMKPTGFYNAITGIAYGFNEMSLDGYLKWSPIVLRDKEYIYEPVYEEASISLITDNHTIFKYKNNKYWSKKSQPWLHI